MFIGASIRALDAQGKITLPRSFLKEAGKTSVVMSPLVDDRVAVWPISEFEQIVYRFNTMGLTQTARGLIFRALFSKAEQTKADHMGRIQIPSGLREYAHLTEDVLLLGMVNRFELWNPKGFN